MSRLRWPDSTNSVSEKPGTIQIFEVSRKGRIVWEYVNPRRAGDERELVATVMGAQRVSPENLEFLAH